MRSTGNATVDQNLELLLMSGQFLMADLYTFTMADGSQQFATNVDVPVTWDTVNQTAAGAGAQIYSSTGLLLTRNKLTWERGITVDELEITVAPRSSTIGGLGWLAAAANGALKGAWCQLDRLFLSSSVSSAYTSLPTFANRPAGLGFANRPGLGWYQGGAARARMTIQGIGSLCLFYGMVTDIDPLGRSSMVIKVRDILDLLSQQWPINLVLPKCCWQLYGPGCGLSKANFTVSGAATAGSTVRAINTGLTQADQYFNLGVIRFTSSALSGLFRTISWYAGGVVTPVVPLPQAPAADDTFTIYPGCDHTIGLNENYVGVTHSNTLINGIANTAGIEAGMLVSGPGIPLGTTVTSVAGGQIEISQAATATAIGVTITVAQSGAGGCAKFNNLVNWRGFPYVPVPETAV